ncbi:MAG TPA: sigma-70 family RNA polymerase sigma factor [Pyrinomonadaceae bacterium]|nr:sigma-70 family RNA polymerase sigma factor [Pyrinomonadaceae bacterium]
MKLSETDINRLVSEGARRLLARAGDGRSLTVESLSSRIRKTIDKYLLRANESATASEVAEFVDSLQADDLCLIISCEAGNQHAWSDLVERFSQTVRSAARAASSNEDAAEDLAQSIWAELHGLRARPDGGSAGKLAYYSGRGSLAGWLRAVVAQLAVDEHRKQSRLVQTEEDADLDRLARVASDGGRLFGASKVVSDPEENVTQTVASSQIEEALAGSLRELSPEDRLLVKLYYFDDLRLREAGALLGVHEATASRRLTRIQNELRRKIGAILVQKRGWTEAETERAFADVAIHLQSDVEAMLQAEAVTADKGGSRPRGG